MEAEISAGEIRQDSVATRLSAAGFPTALEFQIGKGVAGAVDIFPDAARKARDQFRIGAVAKFMDRLLFCAGKFHAQVELAQNRERKRENHDVGFRFHRCSVALKSQTISSSIAGDRFQPRPEFNWMLEAFRQTRRHAIVSFHDVKAFVAHAENAELIRRRFVAHREKEIECALLVDLQTVLTDVSRAQNLRR